MRTTEALLRHLGQQVRARRISQGLTQDQLGRKAGIVGKYVSEIERGTRDVPISTLHALVEHGIGLRLEVTFSSKSGSKPDLKLPPPSPEELVQLLSSLPAERRGRLLALVRDLAEIVGRG